ncbi:MAG: ABC transporter substrate-binding protein [Clostridiales bacterium]|nr:ABC transporter substrate-binding protein [Clostridiales bacterium]
MKKKLLLLLLALVMMLLPGGCAGKSGQITVVLDWLPNTNHTGLYVAQEMGFFADEGLDVQIIKPGKNTAPQLVARGKAQFGVSYQEEVTFARDKGVPVISVAAVIQHNTSCFAAPVSKNIKSPADFAGKTYGGWGGMVEEPMLDYLLDKAGATQKVTVVNIGASDFFNACRAGIDFSWIYYGWTGIEAELRQEALDVIWLRELEAVFDYYTPVLIAEEGWLKDNGETAEKFLAAVTRGYQYAAERPNEAAEILLKHEPGLDRDLVIESQRWLASRYQDEAEYWGRQELAVWRDYAAWLTENGLLGPGFAAEKAFTNEYLAGTEGRGEREEKESTK